MQCIEMVKTAKQGDVVWAFRGGVLQLYAPPCRRRYRMEHLWLLNSHQTKTVME